MENIKRIPVPTAGLMLSLATIGNLVGEYSATVRLIFGGIAAILFVLLTLKILTNFRGFQAGMRDPVAAPVFAGYSMTIILLASYLRPYVAVGAEVLWYVGIAAHFAFIVFFTVRFAAKHDLATVYASWFVPYAGMFLVGITEPVFYPPTGGFSLGKAGFYFSLIAYLFLLPVILYRIHRFGQIDEASMPSIAVACSPGSLMLASYLNAFADKNRIIVLIFLIVSQALYLYVLLQLPKLLTRPFSPCFASFTFPFAISAVALNLTYGYFHALGGAPRLLLWAVKFEELLAVVLVLYVLCGFCYHLFIRPDRRPS